MITEDYCSFEISKLLKEKGFDVKPYHQYYVSSCGKVFGCKGNELKQTTINYTAIAACHNDRCPSHKNCLRWQIGKRNPDIIAGNFAPKSKYSQRCGDWKKGRCAMNKELCKYYRSWVGTSKGEINGACVDYERKILTKCDFIQNKGCWKTQRKEAKNDTRRI